MTYKNETFLISIILFVDLLFLLYGISTLSISYNEANIFFNGKNFIHYVVKYSTSIFGQNNYALKLPFVIFHLLSTILLYKISKKYLKRKADRVLSVIIYILLPGINSAALIVNDSEFVIFFTLLFIYLYQQKKRFLSFFILIVSLFVDNSFSVLYLSLIFYSIYKKDNNLLYLCITLFGLSMYLWGFDIEGKPKNYLLETLAVYMAIFSPLVFLYFVYTEYRIFVKGEKNILWFISFVSLIFSLFLSIRQKIIIEDFAPFAVIAIPLMVKTFLSSYRIRIPELRHWHKLFFSLTMFFLVFNFIAIYFNKPLYLFIKKPSDHFTYRYDFVKELANYLKNKNITKINSDDNKLLLRLKFYGIKKGNNYFIATHKIQNAKCVTISYYHKPVFRVYVSKIHNL